MFDKLMVRYYEPHRKYHDIRHIQWMLMEFEGVRHLCQNPQDIEAAIWLHDAVYDPKAKDNEERSVDLGDELFGEDMSDEMERLIMLTKHDKAPDPGDFDGQVMVDCDLAVLGAEKVLFDAYEEGIKYEYKFVPEKQYREGRAKIMKGFCIRKPGIYCTEHFASRYEMRARLNISQLCRSLEGRNANSPLISQ